MEKNLPLTESPKTEQPVLKLVEVSIRLVMNAEEEPHKLVGLAFYNDGKETLAQLLNEEQTKVIVEMIHVLSDNEEETE